MSNVIKFSAKAKSDMKKAVEKGQSKAKTATSPAGNQKLAAKLKEAQRIKSKLTAPGELARCRKIVEGCYRAAMLLYRMARLWRVIDPKLERNGPWLAMTREELATSAGLSESELVKYALPRLADLIDRAMRADPLRIVVRYCDLLGMQFYDVSVGEHGDAFHEGQDKAAAIAAAHAKAKELGLPRNAVQYRIETESGPAWGTVVPSLDELDPERCALVVRLRAVQPKALEVADAADAFTGAKIIETLTEARKGIELGRYEEAEDHLIRLENTVASEPA